MIANPSRGRCLNAQLETVGWFYRAGFLFSIVLSGEIRQVLPMLGRIDCTNKILQYDCHCTVITIVFFII